MMLFFHFQFPIIVKFHNYFSFLSNFVRYRNYERKDYKTYYWPRER